MGVKRSNMEEIIIKPDTNICKRCGRKLKNLQSRELGMGPVCFHKATSVQRRKLFSSLQKRENTV